MRFFFFWRTHFPQVNTEPKSLEESSKATNAAHRVRNPSTLIDDAQNPVCSSQSTQTYTHAHTDFHKSLQLWWSSIISLLISINTEEFQKFLQPMMKLKNQVAHINQQSFTHPTTNTLKLKNLSSLICWINTKLFLQNWKQNCWYWGGGGGAAAAAVGYNFYFFFPFFLSFFLNVFDETQFLREIN